MSNAETDIHNRILVALSKRYHPCGIFWRQNAGRVRSDRGAWVSLGPPGIADIVGLIDGQAVFIEVKAERLHQQQAHRPHVVTGALQIGLGIRVKVQRARVGGFRQLPGA